MPRIGRSTSTRRSMPPCRRPWRCPAAAACISRMLRRGAGRCRYRQPGNRLGRTHGYRRQPGGDPVIARQLRLRQLGGGILIDFAALEGPRARERVRQAMIAALAGDPARPQVLGWSRLGHLEIVRPRRLRRWPKRCWSRGPRAKAPPTLAFEALRVWRAKPAPDRRQTGGCWSPRRSRRRCAVPRPRGSPAGTAARPPDRDRGRRWHSLAPRLLTSWPGETISGGMANPATASRDADARRRPQLPALRQTVGAAPSAVLLGRCADIDLGRWLKGTYRVETEETAEDGGEAPES